MSNANSIPVDHANVTGHNAAQERLALSDATYRRILWRIMPFLMLVYVVSFIDRSNVGFAKLHFLADLGFNDAIYGIGAGIFYVGYILFEVPSNLWLQKIGARKTLLRIMVLWGIFCAGLAFMTSASHFYVMRFLLGAAEAGLFPGMLLYLTYWVPLSRRARFTALFTASIPLAGLIGGPLSGWLMHVFEGVAGMRGWQWLFIVEGLPACVLGVIAFLYLNDKPAHSKWLSAEQRALVQADMDADQANKPKGGGHSLRDALGNPQLYWLAGMGVAVLVGTGGIFFWLPTIIKKAGVESITMVGLLSAIPFAAAIVIQYLNARHSDRTGERRWHVAIPAIIAGIGWIALPSVQNSIPLSLAMLTLVTAGTFSLTGPFWILPAQFLSGTALAAGIALLSTLAGVGSVFSPMLVGWLSSTTGSLSIGQYYFGAWMLLGAVTLLVGVKPKARPA
ncbi:MFS transporter [Herbaspirillum sp. alder98]|uniref:MFS transporter n=1 Tax=Herbaspirillum sp. alder98 TaxID=2913096 RepID=UPI001CD83788|nr:MFS transporter [Herbaspirillum sp. alder98]MCA1325081.1 MFS transporter [Herbaspirillum sp. alder98]